MATDESLERLKGLHRDLVDLTESRLHNIERLLLELESRVEELRSLLDRPKKNDKSRQTLSSGGTLTFDDVEYTINDDFKQDTIQLADLLDLDELVAAKLYLTALAEQSSIDRVPLVTAVVLFHQRRQYLLETLRLCFKIASDAFDAPDEDVKPPFLTLIALLLQSNGSVFWQKLLDSMEDVEKYMQQVAARIQTLSLTGQAQSEEFVEVMDFQRTSLIKQHESLGAIMHYMTAAEHTNVDNFRSLLAKLKTIDRYDTTLIHYLPSFFTACSQLGANDGRCANAEAVSLHTLITSNKDNDAWTSRMLQALATAFWIAEYSARFADHNDGASSDTVSGGEARTNLFLEALRDGAFQLMISVTQEVRATPWYDPVKKALVNFLMQDSPGLVFDVLPPEQYFQEIYMEQLQNFSEAFITNMPDTLRILRLDEDEHRRQVQGRLQLRGNDYPLHLERFYMVISLAYDGSDPAAEAFWSEPDGNLYGFLIWASQRQPTPRVATFCEMLRSLSSGESNADATHRFLLEDKGFSSGKMRRNSPLSWLHIISELEFYSSTVKDRFVAQQTKTQDDTNIVEPQSEMMLECYLRMIAHLCQQSPAARAWLLSHPTFHIHEHLLLLCSSSIQSRLRGNAFAALAALLYGKTREVSDGMWMAVDAWVSGIGSNPHAVQRQSHAQGSTAASGQAIFELIAGGFEEPNAFVTLLIALVEPLPEDNDLNDALPFPESLGSAYRMPGIETYVDFVLGRVFAKGSADIRDPIQVRLLRCSCLTFAASCLSSFNEDLVVFANQSSVAVNTAIRTSSLAAYARLHPFARCVEWFFNDGVITALMETANQDIKLVNESAADSPLMLGLFQAIRIIDLILTLETTYFEYVRPIVKTQSTGQRQPVANSALVTFEDAILNNLGLVASLGLYCGSGHQDLAIVSLRLLRKLASSRKLSAPVVTSIGRQMDKSRLITALERNADAEIVAVSLALQMQFDERAIEQGPDNPVCVIQLEILRFLNGCLAMVPDRPTIAHALLGFVCHAHTLDVAPDGLFANGTALFHVILRFIALTPDGDAETLVSWLVLAKLEATSLLAKLIKSPISSRIILSELRASEYLFVRWAGQPKITVQTLWDGRSFEAPDFYVAGSGAAYLAVLQQRAALIDYTAMEIRSASLEGLSSLKDRIMATVQGTASFPSGPQVPCPTIFDLVDFFEAEPNDALSLPQTRFVATEDLEACTTRVGGAVKYDIQLAEQLLQLRSNELHVSGQLVAITDEQQLEADTENLLFCLQTNNRNMDIRASHAQVLQSWVQLVIVILENGEMNAQDKNAFVLRALQVVLPRLDQAYANDMPSASLYAHLASALMQQMDVASISAENTLAAETTNERLFQLFSIALVGIYDPHSPSELRLSCSQICHTYLCGLLSKGTSAQRQPCIHSVTARGDGLIESLCDEAFAGSAENRIAALLLLGVLVAIANREKSKSIVDILARLNFINVLINNVKHIPAEVSSEKSSDGQMMTIYNAAFTLLLLISQTRLGASYVVNAGLFSSIRDSGLFSADPDLGFETENPSALTNYYLLLLSLAQILVACLVSRGPDNEQTISLTRTFCHENRPLIVAVFKRNARIGLMGEDALVSKIGSTDSKTKNEVVLAQLADAFTVLVGGCGWLDVSSMLRAMSLVA